MHSMSREQVITLLKSMPASRVKTAEVMYSAPARYQVRGSLINLTLSKEASKDISLQGELYAKAESKHEANFNERASLAFHKGIVSIDGYYSLSHGKLFHTTDKESLGRTEHAQPILLLPYRRPFLHLPLRRIQGKEPRGC
ncbi:MAG: hypothetical protein SO188_07180 [Prevotella sp.]|nr:hypothetical protein [Prevotella sp.]